MLQSMTRTMSALCLQHENLEALLEHDILELLKAYLHIKDY